MAVLVTYILGQFDVDLPVVGQVVVAILFSALVGMHCGAWDQRFDQGRHCDQHYPVDRPRDFRRPGNHLPRR